MHWPNKVNTSEHCAGFLFPSSLTVALSTPVTTLCCTRKHFNLSGTRCNTGAFFFPPGSGLICICNISHLTLLMLSWRHNCVCLVVLAVSFCRGSRWLVVCVSLWMCVSVYCMSCVQACVSVWLTPPTHVAPTLAFLNPQPTGYDHEWTHSLSLSVCRLHTPSLSLSLCKNSPWPQSIYQLSCLPL